MKEIVIVGAGGFGREVEWLINRINNNTTNEKWKLLGFADDNLEKKLKIGNSIVYCNIDELEKMNKKINVIIAIGNSITREKIYNKLKNNKNLEFPNLIDPQAIVEQANLGYGNIICAGVICTINIKINNFVIINLNCTIGHDDVIDDFVTIYPNVNVSGKVRIGRNTEIGTGTQIIQEKDICNNVIIGAGAVVTKNIKESGTYIGIPARRMNDENTDTSK